MTPGTLCLSISEGGPVVPFMLKMPASIMTIYLWNVLSPQNIRVERRIYYMICRWLRLCLKIANQ